MHRALEVAVCPVTQEITYVHQYGRGGVGLGTWREDGYGCPGCGVAVVLFPVEGERGGWDDLEPGLAWALEEERD